MKLDLDIDQTKTLTSSDIRYAGFWIRFVAFILDSVIFGVGLAVPFYFIFDDPLAGMDYTAPLDQQLVFVAAAGQQFLAKSGIYFVIYAICWMRFLGTPGKLILNTQIVDAKTLGPLTIGQSVLRYLGYFVSLFVCFIGFIWVGIDPKKRGFHDLIAGSVVIYKPAIKRSNPTPDC